MTDVQVRQAELAELVALLTATSAVRVTLPTLWDLWATAAPRFIGESTQAAGLAAALRELDRQGVVELPVKAWDASTTPPLPREIRVVAARVKPRQRPWETYPWRGELGWVASLATLPGGRFDDLVAVNRWLARTSGRPVAVVPSRFRSAELFGDEKRLDGMVTTALFGPGRLTLAQLGCERVPPPLPAVVVGAGPDVLVVENSDPYWVAVEGLRHAADHPIGAVVWGMGMSFPSQVGVLNVDVAGLGPVRGVVWYWGDLDPTGLRIAVKAADAEVVDIRPAARLWAAMAEQQVREPGVHDWSTEVGAHWLGKSLWELIAPVRMARGRVAQESVSPDVVGEWVASLGRS